MGKGRLQSLFFLLFIIIIIMYFILSAISPYTTGLKALFKQSDCTGTAPTYKYLTFP